MKTPNHLGVKGRHQPIRSRSRFSTDSHDWEMDIDGESQWSSDEEDPDWARSKKKPTRRIMSNKRSQIKKNTRKSRVTTARPCPRLDHPSDPCESSGEAKLLMRPWLIQQVDKGEVQGLEWMDERRTKLRIPWIHGSSQKWNMEESLLFIKWADYSRKHSSNRPMDHKRWKANFRCALNSLPDVKELSNMSQNKGANAYKVYEFLEAQPRRSEIRRQEKRGIKADTTKAPQRRKSVKTEPSPVVNKTTDKSRPLPASLEPSIRSLATFEDNSRILPHPSLPEPDKYRLNGLPDTPPVTPDHSYAHSTPSPKPIHYHPFNNEAIPTVVEHISQEECVETTPSSHTLPPIRLCCEMTALERVWPEYGLTSCLRSMQDEDSSHSELSDASSPITDMTGDDITELISEIETHENPEALLYEMTSQTEEKTSTDTEPHVQIQYLGLINPNGVLQPTAIIEESLQNEGVSYMTMGCH